MIEFVFTITQGRTGTMSLCELFKRHDPGAIAVHEHLGVESHGTLTPDIGQMRRFNTHGLTREVAAFWGRKFALMRKNANERGAARYVETAHMNAKCGLVEYVLAAEPGHEEDRIRFVILNRAPEKIARSMYERGDMRQLENMWLWYLHPIYPRNLVDPKPYAKHGHLGKLAWYVREMEARKSVYRSKLAGWFDVLTVDIDQPDWFAAVAKSYGLSVPGENGTLIANDGKPSDGRSQVEQRLRDLFDAIPSLRETAEAPT